MDLRSILSKKQKQNVTFESCRTHKPDRAMLTSPQLFTTCQQLHLWLRGHNPTITPFFSWYLSTAVQMIEKSLLYKWQKVWNVSLKALLIVELFVADDFPEGQDGNLCETARCVLCYNSFQKRCIYSKHILYIGYQTYVVSTSYNRGIQPLATIYSNLQKITLLTSSPVHSLSS